MRPPRVRASAAALAAVAGVTILSSYLMASGIYPYMTEAGQTLSDWTEDNLQPLIDKFNAYLVTTGKSYQLTLNGAAPTVKGFLQQGAIVLATDVWSRLREFASWVVDEYSLTDNQSGAEVGVITGGRFIAQFSSVPTSAQLVELGTYAGDDSTTSYFVGCLDGLNVVPYYGNTTVGVTYCLVSDTSFSDVVHSAFWCSLVSSVHYFNTQDFIIYNGQTLYVSALFRPVSKLPNIPTCASIYDDAQGIYNAFHGIGYSSSSSLSGIMADTTAISIPDALPQDVEWGGLIVDGVPDVATPTVLEGVIGTAIAEREKPVVKTATVTLPPNTQLDPDDGDLTPPIVITPFPLPEPSALELGEDILEALESHFPFSVPWDLYNILSRLDADPVAPSWTVSLPAIGALSPISFTIDIGATPFDDWAPTFRAFTGILICLSLFIAATRWVKW